jgi:hypothetical protein
VNGEACRGSRRPTRMAFPSCVRTELEEVYGAIDLSK